MIEDVLLKHARLIAEYCEKTAEEWKWFIEQKPELDRRKNLLLQSINQELSRLGELLREGRESPSSTSLAQPDQAKSVEGPQVVHVLSPSLRSGTNLLGSLLVESGSCHWPPSDRIQAEDFFLKNANLIEDYCNKTTEDSRWPAQGQEHRDRRRNSLLQTIGQGLLTFASPEAGKAPIVLKTPDTDNIHLLPRLFPQSRLLCIIRDGRDAVESAATAYPRATYEYWMKRWAQGARQLLEFMEESQESSRAARWKLIRYEELIQEQSPALEEIFNFVGSITDFSWRDLNSLPVYGSSYLCRENGKFSWEIKPKPKDFNPVGRWTLWDASRKQTFKTIAGAELIKLRYAVDDRW